MPTKYRRKHNSNRGLWAEDHMLEAFKAVDNVYILLLLFLKQKNYAQTGESSKLSCSHHLKTGNSWRKKKAGTRGIFSLEYSAEYLGGGKLQ